MSASPPDKPKLDQPTLLDNKFCLYCGAVFPSNDARTKEHVIGRRFVPRGMFDKQWNLIAWACEGCNGIKADLENDISAITMQPDAAGQFYADDSRLHQEAGRKGENSLSRRTRKPVGKSSEQLSVSGSIMPGLSFSLGFVAPPQFEEDRAFDLASYHVRGLFYWATYNPSTRVGRGLGCIAPIHVACKSDWGNNLLRDFQDRITNWAVGVQVVTAHGFFKARICRSPGDATFWAWALEWNQSYRLIGFFGDEETILKAAHELPQLSIKTMLDGEAGETRYRPERALAHEDDRLFAFPDEPPVSDSR